MKLYSTSDIAKMLNADRAKCVYLLRKIEQSRGVKILFKKGDGKKPHYYTTEEVLKSVMPELFAKEEDIHNIQKLKQDVFELQKKVASLTVSLEDVLSKLNKG